MSRTDLVLLKTKALFPPFHKKISGWMRDSVARNRVSMSGLFDSHKHVLKEWKNPESSGRGTGLQSN